VGDDVVEEKTCYSFSGVFEGGYSFSPFSEIIDCHDDVFVSIARWKVAAMKSMPHLQKGLVVMTGWRREGGVLALLAYS